MLQAAHVCRRQHVTNLTNGAVLLLPASCVVCAGDSVALLARNGTSQRLSEEHRLDNEAEAERVRQAGGVLVRSRPGGAPRVMGTSTQTRYKGSIVTR